MFDRILQTEARIGELKSIQIPRGVRARVYKSTDQTLTTATLTAITFDTERYDTDAIHSTSSNTSRFTIPYDGFYEIGTCIRFASNAVGLRQVRFLVNNTIIIGDIVISACVTSVTDIVLSGVVYQFAATDYIECFCQQVSGGNLNVTAATALSPEFWIEKLIN